MKTIKKEWKKYLSVLEEIDSRITNSGLSEDLWYLQMAYEAEKIGIPNELIEEYLYGDLVVINGMPYNMNGNKIA